MYSGHSLEFLFDVSIFCNEPCSEMSLEQCLTCYNAHFCHPIHLSVGDENRGCDLEDLIYCTENYKRLHPISYPKDESRSEDK